MPNDALYPITEAEKLVRGFLHCQLGKESFTHEAHLLTGLYLLHQHGDQALPILRQHLKDFLKHIGVDSTDTSGYHETMTVFWLWVLKKQFAGPDGKVNWNQQNVDAVIDSPALTDRNLWLTYFTKELMMSTKARKAWVSPDVQPLD